MKTATIDPKSKKGNNPKSELTRLINSAGKLQKAIEVTQQERDRAQSVLDTQYIGLEAGKLELSEKLAAIGELITTHPELKSYQPEAQQFLAKYRASKKTVVLEDGVKPAGAVSLLEEAELDQYLKNKTTRVLDMVAINAQLTGPGKIPALIKRLFRIKPAGHTVKLTPKEENAQ